MHAIRLMSLEHFISSGRKILSSPTVYFLSFLQNLAYCQEIFKTKAFSNVTLIIYNSATNSSTMHFLGEFRVFLNARTTSPPVLSVPAGLVFSGFFTNTLHSPSLHTSSCSSNFLGDTI